MDMVSIAIFLVKSRKHSIDTYSIWTMDVSAEPLEALEAGQPFFWWE